MLDENRDKIVAHQLRIGRNSRQVIKKFVVDDGISVSQLFGEFVDAPEEDEITERDVVKHK